MPCLSVTKNAHKMNVPLHFNNAIKSVGELCTCIKTQNYF